MRALSRPGLVLGLVLLWAGAALAQSGVGLEIDEVIDNRVAAGMFSGSLQLRVGLKGNNLEKASAARVIVKEARDDRGTVLVKADADPPDFMGRDYNNGMVSVSLGAPLRDASSVRMKGSIELFVPGRDPSSTVKVDKAFAKLDAPLSHKTLKSAKIEITPLSPAGYAAKMKERKLDEDAIAKIRAEGVARGVSEKEIEFMIGLAKALESDEPPSEGTVVLSGKKDDFDRIYLIEILGADGKPVNLPQRSTSSRGDDTLMTLVPSSPLPANAALQVVLLTDKSRMTFPFELTFQLP